MTHYRILALIGVLLGLLAVAPIASASHVQCGDVITQDTTLDSDLVCTGAGLIVKGDVALDLAGHTIVGSDAGTGVESFGDYAVKEVRGGTIRGFRSGIMMDGAKAVLVKDLVVERNGAGVICQYAESCVVKGSTLRHNTNAVTLDAADNHASGAVDRNRIYDNRNGVVVIDYSASLTDNRIDHNDEVGVTIDHSAEVEMMRNFVAANGGDGVVVSFMSHAAIVRNHISRNGGTGVSVDWEVAARLQDNRVSGNSGDGILIGRRVKALINDNRTDRNGDDGIDVDPCLEDCEVYSVTVGGNKANLNTDLGIEAAPHTIDGGGNKAKHNGNRAQCIGVRCK